MCDEATDNVATLSGSTRWHYSHNVQLSGHYRLPSHHLSIWRSQLTTGEDSLKVKLRFESKKYSL